MHRNKKEYCRICGMFHRPPPWGIDNQTPSFEICDCCGVEFGYEDATPEAIEKYRKQWINSQAKWYNAKLKPNNWNLNEQLKNLLID